MTSHRAPALWFVAGAVLAACAAAVTLGARAGALVLAATLLAAAVARAVRGGRRPEGLAVRAAWFDVLVLVGLAVAIALLQRSPGV